MSARSKPEIPPLGTPALTLPARGEDLSAGALLAMRWNAPSVAAVENTVSLTRRGTRNYAEKLGHFGRPSVGICGASDAASESAGRRTTAD